MLASAGAESWMPSPVPCTCLLHWLGHAAHTDASHGAQCGDAVSLLLQVVERPPQDDVPLAALAFKIMSDPFVGTLTFCRVYSGIMEVRVPATLTVG